jgi:glycosyltransferase involved in cell wall biosynthesis
LKQFTPDATPADSAEPLSVYVGRFQALKGEDLLLRALVRVRETIPSARRVLAGDGEDRPSLEALATELGLSWSEKADAQTAVEFPGLCADPRPLYARAGVVVLPSRTEGMSNVMLEAMAMGRPIVATRVGGNPDLLDPDGEAARRSPPPPDGVWECANGILVSPENPEALARGIVRVLEDSELGRRLGAAARRHVETHCALDAVAGRYEALLRELRGKSAAEKAGPR